LANAESDQENYFLLEIQMQVGLRIASILGIVFIGFHLLDLVLSLLSTPNDIAISFGVLALGLIIIFSCWAGPRLFQWWISPVKKEKEI